MYVRWVQVCVQIYVHTCAHVCGGQMTMLVVVLNFSTLFFVRQDLSLVCGSPSRLESRESACLCLPRTAIISAFHQACYFYVSFQDQILSKEFTDNSYLPTPGISLYNILSSVNKDMNILSSPEYCSFYLLIFTNFEIEFLKFYSSSLVMFNCNKFFKSNSSFTLCIYFGSYCQLTSD